jgi:MFS family permease
MKAGRTGTGMKITARFFGLKDSPPTILGMARVMGIFLPLVAATVTFSTTFYVIFVAEALGKGDYIQGMALIGPLIVLQMAVQTALDYPTGSLGDWIGQRFVLSFAFGLYAITFYLISQVTFDTPYVLLVVIYAIQGAADAQQSGSWGAWFDNNYRVAVPKDTDRKQYGVMQGRIGMLFQIVSTLALIPGSVMAFIFGRTWVFQLQAMLCVIIAVSLLYVMRDLPEVRNNRSKRPSTKEYGSLLKSGVSYLWSNRFLKYVLFGSMLTTSSIIVWGNLILFPMYYLYLLQDVAVASFRTLLFIPGAFAQGVSGSWSRRFEPKTWIPRFRAVEMCGFVFFVVVGAIMFLLPPSTSPAMVQIFIPFTSIPIMQIPAGNTLPLLILFLTFTSTSFFGGFADILTQRLIIDTIPNKIRNSTYSLLPAIATIFAMPQIALFGWLTRIWGFSLTLFSCGLVSLVGVLMIRKGVKFPRPVATDVVAADSITQQERPKPIEVLSNEDDPDPPDGSSD